MLSDEGGDGIFSIDWRELTKIEMRQACWIQFLDNDRVRRRRSTDCLLWKAGGLHVSDEASDAQ